MNQFDALKTYYGHDTFRPGQEKIIESLLSGRDVLCVMPTGAGKSVCYQIPALLLPGITLVVSPLIALMKDQVRALTQAGIRAAYINSSLTAGQYYKVLALAAKQTYKIIYVAPERLTLEGFQQLCASVPISLLAVDEAHCVSQWGQDFRPSYLRISAFLETLPVRPVVGAFTATATVTVRKDITELLGLHAPLTITTGFDRPNLSFHVRQPKDRMAELLQIIRERPGRCGIVYCATRRTTEEVCQHLQAAGFQAQCYHAGLPDEQRRKTQEDFVFDRCPIMVATNAFGMGIDKSNVSFVIHYNMPKNLESYYQEAGRAGRDGAPAECILLYNGQDVHTNRFLIEHSTPNPELDAASQNAVREKDLERLRQMTFYCTTLGCLRSFMLRYFGENAPPSCGNCSGCCKEEIAEGEGIDVTLPAQLILQCVEEIDGRYGASLLIQLLRGEKNARMEALGLTRLPQYGKLRDFSTDTLRQIIRILQQRGYLSTSGHEYPCLQFTGKNLHPQSGERLLLRLPSKQTDKTTGRHNGNVKESQESVGEKLLATLKKLRRTLADRAGVPAYVIWTDATLTAMCIRLPKTQEELLALPGVGKIKAERYGKQFLDEIRNYLRS